MTVQEYGPTRTGMKLVGKLLSSRERGKFLVDRVQVAAPPLYDETIIMSVRWRKGRVTRVKRR